MNDIQTCKLCGHRFVFFSNMTGILITISYLIFQAEYFQHHADCWKKVIDRYWKDCVDKKYKEIA